MNGNRKRDLTMTSTQTESDGSGDAGGAARRRPPPDRLAPAVEQQINENLKMLYEQQLEQDLPDRLKDLVARLRGTGADK